MQKKLKIIIVDDNKTFREGLTFYLEKLLEHEVIDVFENGKEFLESKTYAKADIILMDIEMPHVNGIEAIKKALWNWKSLNCIAITGYQDKAYLTEFLGAGFKGCVFKENIYNELETAMQTVLKGNFFYPKGMNLEP